MIQIKRILPPSECSIAALVVTLFAAWPAVGQSGGYETTLPEMARLASVAGTPLMDQPGPPDAVDFNEVWARLLRIYSDQGPGYSNQDLVNVWNDVRQKSLRCLGILAAIAKIDDLKPSGWDVFLKTMRDNKTDSQKFDRDTTVVERILAEGSKLVLQQQFRDAENELYGSIGELRHVGDRFARGAPEGRFAMAYLPSWRGVYRGEVLRLRNDSGRDFTNAAVVVTFRSSGKSVTHLHYVDRWRSGGVVGAWYSYAGDTYTSGNAFDSSGTIDVAVYSAGAVSSGQFEFTQNDFDDAVHEYCSELKFSGNFLGEYTENGSGQYYAPGLRLAFTGLGALPVKSVLVRLYSSDGSTNDVVWRGETKLSPGSNHVYRSPLFARETPSFGSNNSPAHMEVVLEFEGTNYQFSYRFY